MTKAALITGAGGGIGSALCRAFREEGYRVVATDLADPPPDHDEFLPADLRSLCADEAARADFAARVREAADGPLSVLVNNAAVQNLGRIEDLTPGDWRETLEVNLLAPFLLVRDFLDDLEDGGSVVNIASIHARLTKPEFVCYATSKAALVGMTRALAVELGSRVRVNAIAPAAIETPMLEEGFVGREAAYRDLAAAHPVGRIGRPEEVARAALFLVSSRASFVTGTCLELDGGIGGRLHDPA